MSLRELEATRFPECLATYLPHPPASCRNAPRPIAELVPQRSQRQKRRVVSPDSSVPRIGDLQAVALRHFQFRGLLQLVHSQVEVLSHREVRNLFSQEAD